MLNICHKQTTPSLHGKDMSHICWTSVTHKQHLLLLGKTWVIDVKQLSQTNNTFSPWETHESYMLNICHTQTTPSLPGKQSVINVKELSARNKQTHRNKHIAYLHASSTVRHHDVGLVVGDVVRRAVWDGARVDLEDAESSEMGGETGDDAASPRATVGDEDGVRDLVRWRDDTRESTHLLDDTLKRTMSRLNSSYNNRRSLSWINPYQTQHSKTILDMAKFLNAHWPSQVEVFGEADSPSRRGCAYSFDGVQWCEKLLQGNKVTQDQDAFSRPYILVCPSTPHSSSAKSFPLHPTIVLQAFLVIFSLQLYPAIWCLPGSLCSHHMSRPSELPLLNDLQQCVMLPNQLCRSPCIALKFPGGGSKAHETRIINDSQETGRDRQESWSESEELGKKWKFKRCS